MISEISKAIVQSLVSPDKELINSEYGIGIFNIDNINIQENLNNEFLEKIIKLCKNPFKVQSESFCQKIK